MEDGMEGGVEESQDQRILRLEAELGFEREARMTAERQLEESEFYEVLQMPNTRVDVFLRPSDDVNRFVVDRYEVTYLGGEPVDEAHLEQEDGAEIGGVNDGEVVEPAVDNGPNAGVVADGPALRMPGNAVSRAIQVGRSAWAPASRSGRRMDVLSATGELRSPPRRRNRAGVHHGGVRVAGRASVGRRRNNHPPNQIAREADDQAVGDRRADDAQAVEESFLRVIRGIRRFADYEGTQPGGNNGDGVE